MTSRGMRNRIPPLAGILLLFAAVAVFSIACGGATPTETPTPTPTATSVPVPTSTPTPQPTPTPSLFPLTITDSNGNRVTLAEPPERIVAIDSAAVEILFAVGEGDRIVGTHDFVSYPPEAAGIEKIGSAFALDFERIAALEPDLIYVFFGAPVADLEKLGATVLYIESPRTLEGVAQQMRRWGEIVDRPSAGEEMAQQLEQSIEKAREAVASVTAGPRVFFLGDPTLWTAGSGTLIQEIFTALKAENIFEDVEDFMQVSPEEIVARDPQVVIGVYSVGPEPMEVLTANPAFQQLPALKDGKVFRGDADLLGTAGPRLVQGIEQVARFLYPELFP
ncbi:MAG: ABC transporter substrate-binding protein [Dehalococcoidia bacterium]